MRNTVGLIRTNSFLPLQKIFWGKNLLFVTQTLPYTTGGGNIGWKRMKGWVDSGGGFRKPGGSRNNSTPLLFQDDYNDDDDDDNADDADDNW